MNKTIQAGALKWIVCLALALITFAVYAPVVHNGFIVLDDGVYIIDNPHIQQGFSWNAIRWAFSSRVYAGFWHPLTWLSHMLDYQLYGLNPIGHHLTNLAFHIANTLLLFLLLQNMTGKLWPSAFAGLLFGIHPMHVESVAWAAERKDVLSAFFFLLALLAYARYVELTKIQCRKSWLVYAFTLLLFALGLMAKSMLVTLPCVLCLLDYWPLGRFQFPFRSQPAAVWKRLALEKVPFVILSAIGCMSSIHAQSQWHALIPLKDFSVIARLGHVFVAYVWYIIKLFWPTDLSVNYCLHLDPPERMMSALALIAGATWFVLWLRRSQPYLLVGWLWFLVMLLPVSGLMQVSTQAYANHYIYLPYIGLLVMVAWGFPVLLAKWRYSKTFLLAGTLLVAALCFNLTVTQVRLWKNTQTLLGRAVALDENNYLAWYALGIDFIDQGNLNKAEYSLRRATAIDPMFYQAWNFLGSVLCARKEFDAAQDAYQMALLYAPDKTEIYNNLGDLFLATGQLQEAITNFQNALELNPDQPEICNKLGHAFAQNHEPDQAVIQFQNALHLQPGAADAELGLAMTLSSKGQNSEAIKHYYKAINLDTNSVIALNNLSWLLATTADAGLRNGNEAVRLAEHACQITRYKEAFLIGTLATAYAEVGRFNDAVVAAQKARTVALAKGQKDIADANGQLLELYKSGRAYHQKAETRP